jgi:hypothetical protein
MPSLKSVARNARPALEVVAELLRDSRDWNPILKSASGGLANVLKSIRVGTISSPSPTSANGLGY